MQTQFSISVKGNTVESVFGEWYKYFNRILDKDTINWFNYN